METKRYPSDLTDTEWSILEPILCPPNPYRLGRRPKVSFREVCNAIFYLNKTGCHKPEPTAGIIDSQSVKGTPESGAQDSGFDGNKKIKGRKRHIVVDTMGYVIALVVHAAHWVDTVMAQAVITHLRSVNQTIRVVFADGGYKKGFIEWCHQHTPIRIEVVKRKSRKRGFRVVKKRWVVERTFGWMSRQRRLGRDYERTTRSSEAMVYIAMTRIMLRHLDPKPSPWKKNKEIPQLVTA